MAAKLIWVRSTIPAKPDGGNTVALYETHDDHPDGEAFVAGPESVQVARTGQVHRLISDGVLEEVEGPAESVPTPPVPRQDRHPAASSGEVIPGVTEAQQRALVAAGYVTTDDIRKASDADLLKVDGVGPATVAALRDATKE